MKLQDVPVTPGRLLGIDVSSHQGVIDWPGLPSVVRFAFLRATCGLATDKRFEENAAACGVPWGAYHALSYGSSPLEQARRFARTNAIHGILPPVLDFEIARPGERASEAVARAVQCATEIEQRIGRRCIVYTYPSFFKRLYDLGANVAPLAARPLWIAHYGRKLQEPTVPRAWSTWHFWQWYGNGYAKLANGADVDVNWWRGTEAELTAFACYGEG